MTAGPTGPRMLASARPPPGPSYEQPEPRLDPGRHARPVRAGRVRRARLDLPAAEHGGAAARLVGEGAAVRAARGVRDVLRAVGLPALPRVRARGARQQRAGRRRQLPDSPRGADPARLLRRAGRNAGTAGGRRRCVRPAAGRRRRCAALLRLRPELPGRHAAEAERRHLDPRGRGGLLPDAAGDRPAGAPSGAGKRRSPNRVLGRPGAARPWLEPARLRSRLGTGRRSRATRVPRLLRLRDAGRPGGRGAAWSGRSWPRQASRGRARGARCGGRRRERTLARTRPDARRARDGAVRRPRRGDRLLAADRGRGDGLRSRSAWIAARPIAWLGTITYGLYLWHIPLLVFARGNGLLPGGVLSGLVVLPVAIALGAASWYVVERPAMRWAGRLPRTSGAATAARSGRSRSRTPARSARPPASSSGRAAAARR